tara:strand:+ start:456 stop:818 length:363 start_codon:yes stop_codon:yes gene_type:complete
MKNFNEHKALLLELIDARFVNENPSINKGSFEFELDLNYNGWLGNVQGSIWSDGEFEMTDISFYSLNESGDDLHIESDNIPMGHRKFWDTLENKMKDNIKAVYEINEQEDSINRDKDEWL